MSSIRRAAPADAEAIFDLERYAYDYPSEHVKLLKKKFEGTFKEYYVLEEEGKIQGSGRLISFDQNIRNSWKKMGGLGSLATSPEIRRQGHASDMMNYGIRLMHEDGYATSMLYPFKDTFYAAFGYINCPPVLSVSVNPAQLRGCRRPLGYSFQRTALKEGADFFKQVHDKSAENHHGALRRSDTRWEEMMTGSDHEIVIVFDSFGEPEGLMLYQNKGYSQFGDSKNVGTMTVKEWYWLSCRARTAMLNYIYLHADQIVSVSIPINPMTDDYYHWVQDRNIPTIRARRSYMARIIDVERAIESIPSPVEGEVRVQVQDKNFDWNNQTFRIYQEDSTLHAENIDDPDCETLVTIEGITALIYGTAHVDTLACFGWIDGPVPPLLTQWFPKTDMWMTEDF
jgi:predicted acetyltransferase